MTAVKIALKEINKREDKKWVLYTYFQTSIQFVEYNKDIHAILNQIYHILVELQNEDKQIILCKVPSHIGTTEMKNQIKQ